MFQFSIGKYVNICWCSIYWEFTFQLARHPGNKRLLFGIKNVYRLTINSSIPLMIIMLMWVFRESVTIINFHKFPQKKHSPIAEIVTYKRNHLKFIDFWQKKIFWNHHTVEFIFNWLEWFFMGSARICLSILNKIDGIYLQCVNPKTNIYPY